MTSPTEKPVPAPQGPALGADDAVLDFSSIAHYVPGAGDGDGLWSRHMFQWLDSQPPPAESLAVTAIDDGAAGEAEIAITGQSSEGGESG